MGAICHSCTKTHQHQSAYKSEVPSLTHSKDINEAPKCKKGLHENDCAKN